MILGKKQTETANRKKKNFQNQYHHQEINKNKQANTPTNKQTNNTTNKQHNIKKPKQTNKQDKTTPRTQQTNKQKKSNQKWKMPGKSYSLFKGTTDNWNNQYNPKMQ